MNNWVLVGSSFLFLIPVIIFETYVKIKPIYENYLAKLVLFTSTVSVLFWSNPIHYGITHKLDGIVAKVTFAILFYYVVFIKVFNAYVLGDVFLGSILFIAIIQLGLMIYSSDYYSQREWCGIEHITCHALFHVFSSICISFAFI